MATHTPKNHPGRSGASRKRTRSSPAAADASRSRRSASGDARASPAPSPVLAEAAKRIAPALRKAGQLHVRAFGTAADVAHGLLAVTPNADALRAAQSAEETLARAHSLNTAADELHCRIDALILHFIVRIINADAVAISSAVVSNDALRRFGLLATAAALPALLDSKETAPKTLEVPANLLKGFNFNADLTALRRFSTDVGAFLAAHPTAANLTPNTGSRLLELRTKVIGPAIHKANEYTTHAYAAHLVRIATATGKSTLNLPDFSAAATAALTRVDTLRAALRPTPRARVINPISAAVLASIAPAPAASPASASSSSSAPVSQPRAPIVAAACAMDTDPDVKKASIPAPSNSHRADDVGWTAQKSRSRSRGPARDPALKQQQHKDSKHVPTTGKESGSAPAPKRPSSGTRGMDKKQTDRRVRTPAHRHEQAGKTNPRNKKGRRDPTSIRGR